MKKNEFLKIVGHIYIFLLNKKENQFFLICNESVSVNKEYNLKRHRETNIDLVNEKKNWKN